MATVNLFATSEYINGGWTKVGALGSVDTINSNDNATSYFSVANGPGSTQYDLGYEVDNMPSNTVSINSVSQTGVFGRSGTGPGTVRFRHDISGTLYNSGATGQTFPASWNTLTTGTFSPGTGSWTKSVIDAARFGVRNQADGANVRNGYVSYLYVTVDYVPGGMFVILHSLLPFIGVMTLPSTVSGLVQYALGSPKRIIEYGRKELEDVQTELRAFQRGYAFMTGIS